MAMLALATAAHAQTAERAFCPARPGKASPTCTVDQGRVQVEVDLFDRTFDKSGGGKTTDTTIATPQVRIGLSPNSELQLAFTPQERITMTGGGASQAVSGIGDTVAGLKFNLTGNGDRFGAALQPFVKIPTAPSTIGNGKVEGGVTVPLSVPLAGGWTLGLSPELDVSANDTGDGYHSAAALAAGLGRALSPEVAFGMELWAAKDFVSKSETQATADFMLAWTPASTHDLQVDVGMNFGLTSATPSTQVSAGIAKRF
jgi:hypothetical protein